MLLAPLDSAAETLTCTGGHLYIEGNFTSGGSYCMEIAGGCSGEWTCPLISFVPQGSSTDTVALQYYRGVSKEVASSIVRILTNLKPSDIKYSFRATPAVLASWKKRANWPKVAGEIRIRKESVPEWLIAAFKSGNFPQTQKRMTTPIENQDSGVAYPPHGYPCLGCHPNGSGGYDSDFGPLLSIGDLSPGQDKLGYKIKNGKLVVPKSTLNKSK